jgi:uncharacterized protein
MIVAKHVTRDRQLILAVCDTKLHGTKVEEGKRQLDLTSNFYSGEETTKEKVIELMRKAYIVNVVGEEAVRCALESELIDPDNIIHINRVPHAQAMIVSE